MPDGSFAALAGTVRLIRSYGIEMLIEWASGQPLSGLVHEADDASTDALAEVALALHRSSRPAPKGLPTACSPPCSATTTPSTLRCCRDCYPFWMAAEPAPTCRRFLF
jgi:hypothetical protein